MSHTPGPWELWSTAHPDEEDRPGIVLMSEMAVGGTGRKYAGVGGCNKPELLANAQLIAAAPDLLEALRGLLSQCRSLKFHPQNIVIVRAADAVLKATGQTL